MVQRATTQKSFKTESTILHNLAGKIKLSFSKIELLAFEGVVTLKRLFSKWPTFVLAPGSYQHMKDSFSPGRSKTNYE